MARGRLLGHIVTQDTRNKIRASLLALKRKQSLEEKLKQKKAQTGRKVSSATKKKISEGRKGEKHWFFGKSFTEKHRKKIADAHRGKRSHLWRGGITTKNHIIRNSIEYRLWRETVFKRDSFTCKECGIKNGLGKSIILNAHHIKPFSLFPELRFCINNGITLCKECHKKTDSYGRPYKELKVINLNV